MFARSVLVAVPIGLVPAVEAAYFASDAAIIALLAMGSAIAAAFVCMLLRRKRDNNSDIAHASDPFDAEAFSLPCRSEKSSLFDCCSKENAGGNCQGDGYEAIDGANNASPSIREGVSCGLTQARGVVCG